jgi:hypothetical protein
MPKSLAELSLNALCRNLTLFHEELPSGLPQDVVDDVISSLVSHSALNATTLRALRNCELRSLNLANCRLVTDDWLKNLSRQCDSPMGSLPASPDMNAVQPIDGLDIDDVDLESQKPSSEKFQRSFEELSECSTSSFVSANEDYPMENAETIEKPTALTTGIYGCESDFTASLTVLDLRGSQHLTDSGLLQLTGLNNLEEVRLDNCHSLVGYGLLVCSLSTMLRTVSLSNCRRLTDEAVINISHLLSLENLFLDGCRCITDRSLSAIGDMGALRRLDISRCDLITDKGLESLENLISLEEICLGWCRLITDSGIDCVTRQPHRDQNLRILDVARCAITNDGMDHIGRLRALEVLDINGCTDISGSALATTLGRLEHLTNLNASYCPNIL